jgi:hypothetical protein
MEDTPLRPLLDQLLQVHRAAWELGEHEVAFHALSAAAHAAENLCDQPALARIAQLSRDELAWLTENEPRHRLAFGIATRNHQSMFEQLAITATAMRQRLAADHVVAQARETATRSIQP